MTPNLLRSLSLIKFAIREATAFVGHSFADEDRQVVDRIVQLLTKLGVKCESGTRPEPKSIRDKVEERLIAAELFVGIFTRREPTKDGGFTTAPWLIEEKAAAIQQGKRLLLFVETGVEQGIGGLQGDHEYIRFDRSDMADALLRAMDYVLAVTVVPLQCDVNYATNNINLRLGTPNINVESEILQLNRAKQLRPNDPTVVLELAERLEKANRREAAIAELQALVRTSPELAEAHHRLGHLLENDGRLDEAIRSYGAALDRNANDFKYHRCFAKCLYKRSQSVSDQGKQKADLERAKRLLERAESIGGERVSKDVSADLFLVEEALASLNFDRKGERNDGRLPNADRPQRVPLNRKKPKKGNRGKRR